VVNAWTQHDVAQLKLICSTLEPRIELLYYPPGTPILSGENMLVVMRLCVLVGLLNFLTGCTKRENYENGMDFSTQSRAKVIFAYNDSQFDDRGAGHYRYPLSLEDREGIFDLRKFQVRDLGSTLEFTLEFRRPLLETSLEPIQAGRGWSHQLIDIYIDTDRHPGSGNTFSLPGRNVEFNREEAWDKAVVITPGSSRDVTNYMLERSEFRDLYQVRRDIYSPNDIKVGNYTLVVRLPKDQIGEPNENWGYQVLIMGYDPTNDSYNGMFNSRVQSFPTETRFGGGTDYEGNPNVIDILSPDKQSQYAVLSAFRSKPYRKDNLLSIIPMIYSKGKQKVPESRRNGMNNTRDPVPQSIDPRYMAPFEGRR